MGLDMYLHKRRYISHEAREQLTHNGLPDGVEPARVCYVIEDIGYWRKANAIHRWFVETVQDCTDECGVYQVSRAQLQELLNRVETVLAHPELAERVLPTMAGFYFGSTDYDEGYRNDLTETRQIVTNALADEEASFEYLASW